MSLSKNPRGLCLRSGRALAAAALITALAACGGSGSPRAAGTSRAGPPGTTGSTTSASAPAGGGGQAPVPAESNPPGDIPDTTVYVPYQTAAGHLLLKVPEGWSRSTAPASSTFTSNLNSITVAWKPTAAAPTVSSVRDTMIRALQASTLAFRLQAVKPLMLAGSPAIEIIYQVNSPPNPATGRQY